MKRRIFPLFLVISVILAAFYGCADTASVIGEYVAQFDEQQGQRIGLQLEPDGQGTWTSVDESISFKWESRAGQIWLHSKTGGIIEGKLLEGDIEFNVPGAGRVTFKKVLIH